MIPADDLCSSVDANGSKWEKVLFPAPLLEPILHRKHKWAFARSFLGFLQLVFKSRYSSSLILSACCGTEVKAALKGLQSPNVPVWGERWDHGCDTWVWFEYLPPPPEQWSIISVCQPPLPAGDSITSILGVFLLFLSLSLFCCLLIFFPRYLLVYFQPPIHF